MSDPRYLFLGGSGRSGTSFVAQQLCQFHEVIGMMDVELKFLGEYNGIPELYTALVSHHGIFRAKMALAKFRDVFNSLFSDAYAQQLPLQTYLDKEQADSLLESYIEALSPHGQDYPGILSDKQFCSITKSFVDSLYSKIETHGDFKRKQFDGTGVHIPNESTPESNASQTLRYRLEKTPHNLLNASLIENVFPDSKYIHVSRDPRAVVASLLKMNWGPDSLQDAVSWYKAYAVSWKHEQDKLTPRNTDVFKFRIEDLHFYKQETVSALCDYLGLRKCPTDRFNIDIEILKTTGTSLTPEQHAELTQQLSEEIHEAGYCTDNIGVPVAPHNHGPYK